MNKKRLYIIDTGNVSLILGILLTFEQRAKSNAFRQLCDKKTSTVMGLAISVMKCQEYDENK